MLQKCDQNEAMKVLATILWRHFGDHILVCFFRHVSQKKKKIRPRLVTQLHTDFFFLVVGLRLSKTPTLKLNVYIGPKLKVLIGDQNRQKKIIIIEYNKG